MLSRNIGFSVRFTLVEIFSTEYGVLFDISGQLMFLAVKPVVWIHIRSSRMPFQDSVEAPSENNGTLTEPM
jgi:hypothetical protein